MCKIGHDLEKVELGHIGSVWMWQFVRSYISEANHGKDSAIKSVIVSFLLRIKISFIAVDCIGNFNIVL